MLSKNFRMTAKTNTLHERGYIFGGTKFAEALTAAKQAEQDQKQAAKMAEVARKEWFDQIRTLYEQARFIAIVARAIHAEKCKIRGSIGKVLHWWADMLLSPAFVKWYLRQPVATSL